MTPINTEGREPGDKTRKPETTLEKFFQGGNAERIKFLEEQIELKNELLILCDEREQKLIKQLSLTRTASTGETEPTETQAKRIAELEEKVKEQEHLIDVLSMEVDDLISSMNSQNR